MFAAHKGSRLPVRLGVCWALLALLAPVAGADLTSSPLAPGAERRARLVKRPDERRPAQQLTLPVFGRPLTIGGSGEVATQYERNRRLGRPPESDELAVDLSLRVEFLYLPLDKLLVYAAVNTFFDTIPWESRGQTDYDFIAGWPELWFFYDDMFSTGLSLQVGRQRVSDSREWWWDENLDAIRLLYDRRDLHFQALVAQQLFERNTLDDRIAPSNEDILRFISHTRWRYAEDNYLNLYVHHGDDGSYTHCELELRSNRPECKRGQFPDLLYRRDQDERDARLTWFGTGVDGRIKGRAGRLYYWGNVAGVLGTETTIDFDASNLGPGQPNRLVDDADEHDVEGWGLDLVLTWLPAATPGLALTAGYAYGSGDKGTDEEEYGGFRQSGLQDNNGKFRGVTRFRYYGEFLEPNLANLHIGTAAVGFRFLRATSIELIYHAYAQAELANHLFDTNLRADPNGLNRFIGQEIDLVIGIREWGNRFDLEVIGSAFRAGDAFGDAAGEMSYLVGFEANLNF